MLAKLAIGFALNSLQVCQRGWNPQRDACRELMRLPGLAGLARPPPAYDAGAVSAGAPVSRALPQGSVGASALASASSGSSTGAAICDPPASPRFRRLPSNEYRLEQRVARIGA